LTHEKRSFIGISCLIASEDIMKIKLFEEIHPGEILSEDFMKPMGISVDRLAVDLEVYPNFIGELIDGSRPITADTALRLSSFFSVDLNFWVNLQSEYDSRIDGLISKKP
jgi:addiction module HigA family antidote